MTSLINLIILACAPIAVVFLAWRWQFPKGASTQDRYEPTNGQAESAATGMIAGPEPPRVRRWIDEGPIVFEGLRRILDERNQLEEAAAATQEKGQRLRQEYEELREERRRLQGEAERVDKERAESAQWLTTVINEATSRFQIEQPPA